MSEEAVVSNPVETEAAPQISATQAQTMPLGELRAAAFNTEQPAQPSTEASSSAEQAPAQSEPYTMSQDGGSFVLKYKTGETFKGASELDVYRKAAENAVKTTEWARQVRRQYDEFQQKPEQAITMPDEPINPEMVAEQAGQVEQAQEIQRQALREYFTKEVLTPEVKASIVAESLGVAPEALPQVINDINSSWRESKINVAVFDFHAQNPSYIDTPQNTAAMSQALSHLPPNQIPTAQDLQMAWARCLYQGNARPYVPQAEQPRRTPPPMPAGPSGGLGGGNDWTKDINALRKEAFGG